MLSLKRHAITNALAAISIPIVKSVVNVPIMALITSGIFISKQVVNACWFCVFDGFEVIHGFDTIVKPITVA